MGFIHDQIAEAGHEVDFLCADDLSTSGITRSHSV